MKPSASGRRSKVLFRSVLADPLYRGVSGQNVPGTVAKMLSPETLQRVVTGLTGFEPRIEGVDIVREEAGLRALVAAYLPRRGITHRGQRT